MIKFICAFFLFCASIVSAQSVPLWALGRNGSGDLQVNGGPTLGTVTFASEYVNSSPSDTETGGCTPVDRVAYDWTYDGYLGAGWGVCITPGACPDNDRQDLTHPTWHDTANRHVLIKNWDVRNAYKTTVTGDPHVDVTQILNAPGWNGWFVMQDSTLMNSDDGIVQWQFGAGAGNLSGCGSFEGQAVANFGGVVVQNLVLDQQAEFTQDCLDRGVDTAGCSGEGNFLGSWEAGTGWLINYQTNGWTITLQQAWDKVVVVGSTPDLALRSDGIGYNFSTASACTGSPCMLSNNVWGPYANIEAAIAAGHTEPPFVRLSCSGWETPPPHCSGPGAPGSGPTNFRLGGE